MRRGLVQCLERNRLSQLEVNNAPVGMHADGGGVERCRLDEGGSLVDPVCCWTYRVGVRAL
jgi:hypothetical protein